jgi:hypothetical protein
MENINSRLADNLLLEYYTYHGRHISAIDIFFCDRKCFYGLKLQGLITDEEERFLKRYEKELREIYTGYLFPNIRKERLKIFILNHQIPKTEYSYNHYEVGPSENDIGTAKIKVTRKMIPCMVIGKKQKVCPKCRSQIKPVYVTVSQGETLQLRKCVACGTYLVRYGYFIANRHNLICLNPEYLDVIERKKPNKPAGKMPLVTSTPAARELTYCSMIVVERAENKKIQVHVRDVKKSDKKAEPWIFSLSSRWGISCMKAIANHATEVVLDGLVYDIENVKVLEPQYIKRYEDPSYFSKNIVGSNDRMIKDFTAQKVDVHVYYKLNNSCMKKKHPIKNVAMRSINLITGRTCQINAFYCPLCDQYFINHEAVKDMISRNLYPKFQYIVENDFEGNLKPVSQLMLYGYNAKADGPSSIERHSILKWVIDSGLMSRAEIIRDLQFKASYNGKKQGNESAREKWEEDIEFLSSYNTSQDKKDVHGILRR